LGNKSGTGVISGMQSMRVHIGASGDNGVRPYWYDNVVVWCSCKMDHSTL